MLRAEFVRYKRTNSTLAWRKVFSATYTPPPKMVRTFFAPAGANSARLFDRLGPGAEAPRRGFLRPLRQKKGRWWLWGMRERVYNEENAGLNGGLWEVFYDRSGSDGEDDRLLCGQPA